MKKIYFNFFFPVVALITWNKKRVVCEGKHSPKGIRINQTGLHPEKKVALYALLKRLYVVMILYYRFQISVEVGTSHVILQVKIRGL